MNKIASSDSWAALTTFVAAATYLFDAGSNAATAAKYYQFYRQGPGQVHDEIGSSINAGGVFTVVVTLIVVAHITNLVMFCMTPEGRAEHPVTAAFFLPLIHLKRLMRVLRRTGTVHGFKDITSVEAGRLYNILAAALETGPQLIFQYSVLHVVGSNCNNCKLPKVLLISIIGSSISGAYNGGAAVASMLHSNLCARLAIGIAAGTHIVCALIVRSLAFALIVAGAPTLYIVLYASFAFGVPCVLFWAFTKPRSMHINMRSKMRSALHQQGWKILQAVANGHVSLSLGPLYPLTRDAHGRELQGCRSFHGVLTLAAMAHLMLDLGGILLIYEAAFYKPSDGRDNYPPPCTPLMYYPDVFLPCKLFLVLLPLAVSLYILSMVAYLLIDKTIHSLSHCFTIIHIMMGVVFYQRWRPLLPKTKHPTSQVNVHKSQEVLGKFPL